MARPAMRKDEKRVQVSISVSPEASALARASKNQSQFFEGAALFQRDFADVMKLYSKGKVSAEDAMDLLIVRSRASEDSVPLADVMKQMKK